ncbi:kinase-like domain-containing protein [Auriculariales sp. MPI-PUGE-AT-0066]|nr:kinase-like domain-containing protein [Auriculariales sp. MPI-PUGE-AT-0066]
MLVSPKPLISPGTLISPLPGPPVSKHTYLVDPGAPKPHRTPQTVRPPPTESSFKPLAAPKRYEKEKERPRPRNPVLIRTEAQEQEVYRRTFHGCGKLSDYVLQEKIGEGTFGEVHRATRKDVADAPTVALKRIFMHSESEGLPVTALREIRILKLLKHKNVLPLVDMIIHRSDNNAKTGDLYMVFPYMDYDLAGLLENSAAKLTPSMIKFFMFQLLEGTEYLHRNFILHRDMKAANLLIERSGRLIIADFGLARPFDAPDLPSDRRDWGTRFTNMVVTRWYRPPELLLGERHYTAAVDLWGIGCIYAEMWTRGPILKGQSDGHQFDIIIQLCGTPTKDNWRECPAWRQDFNPQAEVKYPDKWGTHARAVTQRFNVITCSSGMELLDKLLVCNPEERLTATQALQHDYFYENPLPMKLGE